MKLRAAVGVGILLTCLLAITCTRQTPGNQSSGEQNRPNSAENAPPSPPPAPPAAEERAQQQPAPSAAALSGNRAAAGAVETSTPKPSPVPVTLPAGTVLTVRTTDTISAKSSQAGQTFQAVVAQPITRNGKTAVPNGTSVTGKIVQAHQGGKIKGASDLALQLTSLSVHGVSHAITTDQFVQQQKGKGGRTTKMGVGGGAAGALIGGIAGGGKGAAIGALAGGGAGVAGSALTGNKELAIPAESVLQFKLSNPVQLSTNPAPSAAKEPNQ